MTASTFIPNSRHNADICLIYTDSSKRNAASPQKIWRNKESLLQRKWAASQKTAHRQK